MYAVGMPRRPQQHGASAPDVRRYAQEMTNMLRQRDPQAYRAFIRQWRDLHQRGAAEQLLAMDDAALRLRMEHMILSTSALQDLHPSAREYIETQEGQTADGGRRELSGRPPSAVRRP
jgi:hypothetical protein